MRRVLLIIGTLAVVTTAFVILAWLQRGVEITSGRKLTPATKPAATTQIGSIGRGAAPWMVISDVNTGLPKVRFRGEEFTPQPGDQVAVNHPQAEFYMGRDRSRVVSIEGKTGTIIVPGRGPQIRANLSPTTMQPPSRGNMRNVTVKYYLTREDLAANRPELTLTLDNAYFDNETYEIATEDYVDAQGKTVPGREVPVQVRGDTFDFDGKGLVIRWDDKSQQLRSLTVFKGERLVIKKMDRLKGSNAGKGSGAAMTLGAVQLAAADRKTAVAQAAQAPARNVYRATFDQDVVVTQEQQELATARQLLVDFLSPDSDETEPAAGAKPTTKSAKKPPAAGTAKAAPVIASPLKKEVPVVIRWGGPLTVMRAPDEPLKPQNTDDAVIRLAGTDDAPAHVNANGGSIEATLIAYQLEGQFAWVEGSPGHPAKMTDKNDTVLTTPQLRYSQQQGKATLRGPSTATIVRDKEGQPKTLNASWKELAEATFSGPADAASITGLRLQGDVQVTDPRIPRFKAGLLELQFKPAAEGSESKKPVLRHVTASRDVDCTLVDAHERQWDVRCQNLGLEVENDANGQPYPTVIDADGSVYAGNGNEYLRAQVVHAEMAPPAEKAQKADEMEIAGLRNLRASGQVEAKSDKGGSGKGEIVKAERLQVVQQDGKPHVVLEGSPASVQTERSLLAGSFIELDSTNETAQVVGGGRLVVPDSAASKAGKGLPIEVSWTGPARVSGPQDSVVVDGNIQVRYTDDKGTANDASGDHLEAKLAKDPKAATRPAEKGQIAFLKDRYARQFVLSANNDRDVRIQSLKMAQDRTIIRQINVMGMRLECSLTPDGITHLEVLATAQHPGRMLYIDMPPATRKAAKPTDLTKTKEFAGATAFAWKDRLTYDRLNQQVTMQGDVLVRHEPQTITGRAFEMQCDTVVADVVPLGGSTTTAAPAETLDISRLVLKGRPVQITREDLMILAPMVQYDPATADVLAVGSQRDPVRIERGRTTGTFETARLNPETNEVVVTGARGVGRQ